MYELVFCCKQYWNVNNNINNTEHLQNTDPPFWMRILPGASRRIFHFPPSRAFPRALNGVNKPKRLGTRLSHPWVRPQRPFIYDFNYFFYPTPPPPLPAVANISGGNVLGALFISKVPLETGAPPPTFWCFLRPCPNLINIFNRSLPSSCNIEPATAR
jgi:hypothetical protein